MNPKQKYKGQTIKASVEVPDGHWLVASGTIDLGGPLIEKQHISAAYGILSHGGYRNTLKGFPLKLFKNQPTKIYANTIEKGLTPAKAPGIITELSLADVLSAGANPVVIIDAAGTARLKK